MPIADKLRTLAAMATPQGAAQFSEVRTFAARHQLPGSLRDHLRAWPLADRFGLTILPPLRFDEGLVVDIGANVGHFTAAVLATDPRAHVLAVEPGESLAQLRATHGADPRVTIDSRAISDTSGVAEIHETEASVFASLRRPLDGLEEHYGKVAAVTSTHEVQTVSLDELLNDEPVSVLKIDVQGHERALIAGGGAALHRARAVLLEVNFQQHYEDEASFHELDGLMADHGLALRAFGRMHREGDGPLLWADACYMPLRQP